MSAGPPCQTSIIFVPVGASVDFGRAQKPPKYPAKPRPETWRPSRAIPHRQVDREAIRHTLDRAKRTLVETKAQIEAMLRA
jgi:hypothetical protein